MLSTCLFCPYIASPADASIQRGMPIVSHCPDLGNIPDPLRRPEW